MYRDPDLSAAPSGVALPDGALTLWRKALTHPSVDIRCKAAEAITRAHGLGIRGLAEAVPDLVAAVERRDQSPTVRAAAARALVTLDAKQTAGPLWRQAKVGGTDLREVVEPALARWGARDACAVWLERLAEPTTPHRTLILAMRGLASLREPRAADRLRSLVLSPRTLLPVRLEAARALGEIQSSGLEADVRTLTAATPPSLSARLAAASLLRRHTGPDAVALLHQVAVDPAPTVAAVAAARLLEIDVRQGAGPRDRWLASPDVTLRAYGVEVLHRHDTTDSVPLLAKRLDDPHPDVRGKARRALYERATAKGQREKVIAEATAILAADGWRGQEQAIILLVDLKHTPVVGRLIELLPAARPEVFVTAAAGLRKLSDATSLAGALTYLDAEQKRTRGGPPLPGREHLDAALVDHQLSQLLQLLGRHRYKPATPVIRRLLPRTGRGPYEARAAAAWAIGWIHEGDPAAGQAALLEERLNDISSMPPEDGRVRRLCAVSLGRLRAKESVDSLRRYMPREQRNGEPIGDACAWAVERLTGETLPVAKPRRTTLLNWFLVPSGPTP